MELPKAVVQFFSQPFQGKTTLDYFCELIILNDGSSEVTKVIPDETSRKGLHPQEALHLTQLVNFLKGILFALGSEELEIEILQFVSREVERKQTGSLLYIPTGSEIGRFS